MTSLKSLAMLGLHVMLVFAVIQPLAVVLLAILVIVPDLFSYDGAASFVGWGLGAVLLVGGGQAIGGVTAVIALIVGLPVRLIPGVRRWWIANGEIAFAGIATGTVLIILAWSFGTTQTGVLGGIEFRQWVPNLWLLLVGWLLFAFSLTHVWWPQRWRPPSRALVVPISSTAI